MLWAQGLMAFVRRRHQSLCRGPTYEADLATLGRERLLFDLEIAVHKFQDLPEQREP